MFNRALPVLLCLTVGWSVPGCDVDPRPRSGLSLVDGPIIQLTEAGAPLPSLDGGLPPPTPDWGSAPPPADQGPVPQLDQGAAPPPDTTPPGPGPGDYDFTQHIQWHSIPSTGASCNASQYGAFYCDVMTHTKAPYLGADALTNVHESQHFMAHENDSSTPAADKFIYYQQGKGAFWPEPQLSTQGIYDSIKYKGTTYNTYIAGRPGQALGENIVDEWRAYLTEEIAAIQMAKLKGQGPGSIGGLVLGGIEFLYYNAAALHALKTKEPAFLQNNPQAKAVFAMLAEVAKQWTIDQGVVPGMFVSTSNAKANAMLNELRSGPNSQHIRDTIKALYGPKWASRVLGIP
jgi:hypothetical protein